MRPDMKKLEREKESGKEAEKEPPLEGRGNPGDNGVLEAQRRGLREEGWLVPQQLPKAVNQ